MSFIADLFKPKAEDKLTAAKAKKAAIAEKCASEHTVVDKEISDAEAEAKSVNPIAEAAPISEKEEDTQEDVEKATQEEDMEGEMEDKTEDNKGGKSKKKKGGKSKKRKFSKKRKGGKRTKSQKKRR